MPKGELVGKLDGRIVAAEKQFETEKRLLLASASSAEEVDKARVYLKGLEQELAELHKLRVCLAGGLAIE